MADGTATVLVTTGSTAGPFTSSVTTGGATLSFSLGTVSRHTALVRPIWILTSSMAASKLSRLAVNPSNTRRSSVDRLLPIASLSSGTTVKALVNSSTN
jgi:hypothetical protein